MKETGGENEVNFWKLKAIDFLIETGKFVKNSDIAEFRNETLVRLKEIVGSHGIHLLSKADEVSEFIIYSSDQEVVSSFTDTSFLRQPALTEGLIYHELIQVPGRSHFLKKYTSVIYLPIDETFFAGEVIFTWENTFDVPSAGLTVFLNLAMTRIKGIMRLASTKYAAEDIGVKFDAVFHTVSQGLIFMDDSGKEALVNEQAKRMLGIIAEGEKFPPVVVSEGMKKLRERAVNQEEINATALVLFREPEKKINNWRWEFTDKVFSVSSSPTISDRIKGRLWVFEDISDLYFANHKLQQANKDINIKNERLEALNTEKDDLIGIVSHDLRSPFLRIKVLSSFISLEPGTLSGEQKSMINLIERVADQGVRLIKDLLDISAIENQQTNKKIKKIDLVTIIDTAMTEFKMLAEKKDINISFVSAASQTMVMADHDYLVRILDNLVTNAIKFSHPRKTVTISLEKKENDTLLLTVQDEGQGIREDEMKNLFGKFSKLSARPTAKESSSGLGLYIVKSLVEETGGRIWCESVWKQGTTFFVELPAAVTS